MNRREAPLIADELYGLRTWVLRGGELCALASGFTWPDGDQVVEAQCTRRSHRAPHHGCACGIYAWHPSAEAARIVFGEACRDGEAVGGLIAAWGDVEVHATGFRAQFARPHALVLVDHWHDLHRRRIAALAARYRAHVLRVRSAADLRRYCEEHALGLGPSVVSQLVGAREQHEFEQRERRRKAAARAQRTAERLARAAGVRTYGWR